VNGDAGLLRGTLDDDARNAGLSQALLEVFTNLEILVQQHRVLTARRVPTGIPGPVDAQTETDWIDFLTH
jgi:hypothetical protein